MATTTLPVAVRNAMLDAITTFAGANSLIRFYSGTMPSNNGSLSGNTLLGTLTCSATLAAAASGGVLTMNAITQDSAADATATATFARHFKSDGTTIVADYDVTNSAGSGTIKLNNVSIVQDGPIALTSFTLTLNNAA